MKADKIVDDFGKVFIENVWDYTIDVMKNTIDGKMKSEKSKILYKKINELDNDVKKIIKEIIMETIQQNTFHILNFFEQEESYIIGFNDGVKIVDLKELSDGIAGELYGDDGWIEKYGKGKI